MHPKHVVARLYLVPRAFTSSLFPTNSIRRHCFRAKELIALVNIAKGLEVGIWTGGKNKK